MKQIDTKDADALRLELSTALHEAGVDGVRIYKIFNLPIGDSKLPATEHQIRARVDFALSEAVISKQLAAIENVKFSFFVSKKKRALIMEDLIKEISNTLTELRSKYNAVLVAEQTKEWSIYRGNIYSNYYQYVNDGPHEIPSLYEYGALNAWSQKVSSLISSI